MAPWSGYWGTPNSLSRRCYTQTFSKCKHRHWSSHPHTQALYAAPGTWSRCATASGARHHGQGWSQSPTSQAGGLCHRRGVRGWWHRHPTHVTIEESYHRGSPKNATGGTGAHGQRTPKPYEDKEHYTMAPCNGITCQAVSHSTGLCTTSVWPADGCQPQHEGTL